MDPRNPLLCPLARDSGFFVLGASSMPQAPNRAGLAQLLRAQIDALDGVLSEIEMTGVRSAVHFDELEQRAADAARGVRDAFRKGVWR
jgi:hypothetical protein